MKGLVAMAATSALPGCAAPPVSRVPRTMAMWEFSWLVRRSGAEAEYADWGRVLDEAAERGYECLRIDAFPHLIARGLDGSRPEAFTVLPQPEGFMWGNHDEVTVAPASALREFIAAVAERGMKVSLSTWLNDDSTHRQAEVRTPNDFARIWRETIEVLEPGNLLDHVAWVDLCNEFPTTTRFFPAAAQSIFGESPLVVGREWTDGELVTINRYYSEAIPALRERFPELLYTLSNTVVGEASFFRLDLSEVDLLDTHLWLSNNPRFLLLSGLAHLLLDAPNWQEIVDTNWQTADELYFSRKAEWVAYLNDTIGRWGTLAHRWNVPIVNTEGWAVVNFEDASTPTDGAEWSVVQDCSWEAARLARNHGWAGHCSSNFAQPHFERNWGDVAYHQDFNALLNRR